MYSILHIEDDKNDHRLLCMNAHKSYPDMRFTRAATGKEAIEILANETYDCIICDFRVPDMDGLEFIKHLRYSGNQIPIIFLTGEGNEKVAAEAFRLGANDYFSKSDTFALQDRLLNSVMNAIRSHQAAREQAAMEERFRIAATSLSNLIYEWDVATDELRWFGQLEKALGYNEQKIMRTISGFLDYVHPDDVDRLRKAIQFFRKNKNNGSMLESYRVRAADGTWRHWEDRAHANMDKDGTIIKWIGVCTDVTQRKVAQQRQAKLNRALHLLAGCTHLSIRAANEEEFLQDLAGMLQSRGDYSFVWIGYKEDGDTGAVIPVARAGNDNGYLDSITIRWDESEDGKGPAGSAIRTGHIQTMNYQEGSPNNSLWQHEARQRGYNFGIALPLHVHSEVIGSINLYSNFHYEPSDEELQLLHDLSMEAGFAIESLRGKQRNDEMRVLLEQRERMLRNCESFTGVVSYSWKIAEDDVYWSPSAFAFFGYESDGRVPSPEELLKLVAEEDKEWVVKRLDKTRRNPADFEMTYGVRTNDGRSIKVRDIGKVEIDERGDTWIIGVVKEVTA